MIGRQLIAKVSRPRMRYAAGILTTFIRIALGCVFIWGSLPKLRQPYDFLSAVYSYELVGPKLGMMVAMTLPWLELLVGICLVAGIFASGALLAGAAMATVFTFALCSAISRGLRINCACFGPGDSPITYFTVMRTSLILLLSVAGYLCMIFIGPDGEIGGIERSS